VPGQQFVLYGSTTIQLDELAPVVVAHPLSDTSVVRPGVQVAQSTVDSTLRMTLGNSWGDSGMAMDAGVQLWFTSVDDRAFTGVWKEASRRAPLAGGYFCATKANGGEQNGPQL
jgi:hypothetical protein